MFKIGDQIVYPMHGAGTIEAVDEKEIEGVSRRYYCLRIHQNGIQIMLPCDNADKVGIRRVIEKSEMRTVRDTLKAATGEMAQIWNHRYRDNMEKLKTGKIIHVAEVVRDLMRTDCEKKLSTGEKKMLSSAKQILIGELVLASGKCVEEMDLLIEKAVMV
ncbi:MAG: CarD family transcriptional regulator [Clostridiales Family XIII bacterium]|nr:CarD family transcriptional regulator [Clostridiales Family XIII bacterium]